jgi:hypothetical protein
MSVTGAAATRRAAVGALLRLAVAACARRSWSAARRRSAMCCRAAMAVNSECMAAPRVGMWCGHCDLRWLRRACSPANAPAGIATPDVRSRRRKVGGERRRPGRSPRRMRFGILGPLQVIGDDGRELALGGRMPRTVLAILLLRPNEVVSSDRLVEELWAGDRDSARERARQRFVRGAQPRRAASGPSPNGSSTRWASGWLAPNESATSGT